jgi:hypothetical protein
VKEFVCPHCHTRVSETASVCAGCGAEVVRGLTKRGRAVVGLISVEVAVLIAVVILRALEVVHGRPALPSPKADDGLMVIAAVMLLLVVPFLIGSRAARLLWRSRVRFYRQYQQR